VSTAARSRGITPNATTADGITCPYSVIILSDKRYCPSARTIVLMQPTWPIAKTRGETKAVSDNICQIQYGSSTSCTTSTVYTARNCHPVIQL
jgi:hypothetical protein